MASIDATAIDTETTATPTAEPVGDAAVEGRATSLLWGVAVVGVCLLAALVVTWPLAANLTTAVPRGTERESTVQLLNIWTLWWNADRLAHGFAGYWDAPFFYPWLGVFTFSEPQPLMGVMVAPLWWLGAPMALTYNLAILVSLALNGIFAYRLARALDLPRLPALLGGVIAVALPFVGSMSGVSHLVPLFGMFWTLEGLVLFGKSGEIRHATWAALGYLATYLTSQQYALMFAPFAVAAALVALAQQGFKPRPALVLLGQGLAVGALVLLLILPGMTLHNDLGFQRPALVVQALSANPGDIATQTPSDFLTRPGTSWLNFPSRDPRDTSGLFPGLLLLALAALGAFYGLRARDRATRRWTVYLALGFVAAAVLAAGLNFNFYGFQPFGLFRAWVPGYSELRSPFRFATIMQLMLVVLAVIALSDYARRYASSRGALSLGVALAVVLALLASAENLTVPGPLTQVPASARTAWTEWLRGQPDLNVVAHVPFPAGLRVGDYEVETRRMLAQIDHNKAIVNGYSGFFPPGYTEFQVAMAQDFPAKDLLCVMIKEQGVDTLVVDRVWLDGNRSRMDAFSEFLTPRYEDLQVAIYRLQAPQGTCIAAQP